jgi:mannose-6-phosphate isomerase-like protein (cupin superfamily)
MSILKSLARLVLFGRRSEPKEPRDALPRPKPPESPPSSGRLCAKPWGMSHTVRQTDDVEVSAIVVAGGGYCSRHYHRSKWNLFHVLSGELEVVLYSPAGVPQSFTTVHGGEEMLVAPGVQHRFRAYEPCCAVEVYWPESGKALEHDDIVRFDEGGRK